MAHLGKVDLGTRKQWLALVLFVAAMSTCVHYGKRFVFHGPLNIWHIGAIMAALAFPVVLLAGFYRQGGANNGQSPAQPAWKRWLGLFADAATAAAGLSALLIAGLLGAADLFGTSRADMRAEVLAVRDSGSRDRFCKQHATVRLMASRTELCTEGMFEPIILKQGYTLDATVKTVPYGFLIDSLRFAGAPRLPAARPLP